MTHTPLSRRASALPYCTPPAPKTAVWGLLDDLTIARKQFDLLPATITVLRALCSFLPKDGDGAMVVWPSNATLCERAAGMPERSLRRQLERLTDAGLIARKSSGNGKRFALRIRRVVVDAYGFDLTPLFARQDEIRDAAEDVEAEQQTLRLLRSRIRTQLQTLAATQDNPIAEDECRLILTALRRQDNLAELQTILETLSETGCVTAHLAASNGRNDRHLQNTMEESHFVRTKPETSAQPESTTDCAEAMISFPQCMDAITEALSFAEEPVTDWASLARLSDSLAPMIGVKPQLWHRCMANMGKLPAAIALLCVVQIHSKLRSPASYLNRLGQLALAGKFSLTALVRNAQRHTGQGAL